MFHLQPVCRAETKRASSQVRRTRVSTRNSFPCSFHCVLSALFPNNDSACYGQENLVLEISPLSIIFLSDPLSNTPPPLIRPFFLCHKPLPANTQLSFAPED